ncbi:MAG: lysyl-tRNA synthetase class 2 [Myxococcota bacterium]
MRTAALIGHGASGDLVRIVDGTAQVVAQNRSTRQLDAQDWWRLHRIMPNLRRRHEVLRGIRSFLDDDGFLEVETPLITRGPAIEPHLDSIPVVVSGESRWLVTSPEYHLKRLLSSGIERLYSLGKVFRNEERGRHHQPEFTMLEWYRVGEPVEALMRDVEHFVALASGRARPWTRLTVAEALSRWAQPADDPAEVVRLLVEFVEPALAELGCVFLTDYPIELASLARPNPADPSVSERFEAYVDGVELANGFGELTDAVEQRRRFEAELLERQRQGLPTPPLDERFLDALACGIPPVSGIALGIDRLLMIGLPAERIDDVVTLVYEDN